jgi:hypothetical protein
LLRGRKKRWRRLLMKKSLLRRVPRRAWRRCGAWRKGHDGAAAEEERRAERETFGPPAVVMAVEAKAFVAEAGSGAWRACASTNTLAK